MPDLSLQQFNALPRQQALDTILSWCRCQLWAGQVADARPFKSLEQLQQQADVSWQKMGTEQHLEAFTAHPMIGDVEHLRRKYADTARAEQGQVLDADETTLQGLARLNQDYFDRFGFIFIVCASGKSAAQMLEMIRQRIHNSRDQELANAAAEQGKILQLRLRKTFGET